MSRLRIMGIDPGLTRTGFGVVEKQGNKVKALAHGTLRTIPERPTADRLVSLLEELQELMNEWSPAEVAVERIFLKGNAGTAIPSIQASGVALAAAGGAGLEVAEYSPAQVKQATVGVGSATKEQVRLMLGRLISFDSAPPAEPDAVDALAVAFCHLSHRKLGRLEEAVS